MSFSGCFNTSSAVLKDVYQVTRNTLDASEDMFSVNFPYYVTFTAESETLSMNFIVKNINNLSIYFEQADANDQNEIYNKNDHL